MENQASSKSIILNNGLYCGLALVVFGLIMYATGNHLNISLWLINILFLAIVMILFPILGMNQFKKLNNGLMSWTQGVKIGMGIVLLGSLISFIYQYVFSTFIEPDFFVQLEEVTRNYYLDLGLTEEQIDSQIEAQFKNQGKPLGYAFGLLFYAFVGFVISAIVAAIKKHSEEDNY